MKASMWADVVNKYNVPGGDNPNSAQRPSSNTATSSSSTPAIPKPTRPHADEFPTFPEKPDIPAGFVLPDPLGRSGGNPALTAPPASDDIEATIEVSANPAFLGHLRDDRLRARQRHAVGSPPPTLPNDDAAATAQHHAGAAASASDNATAAQAQPQRPIWLIVAAIVALVVVGVVVAWVATS